jgi:hypothetical protein
MTTDVTYEQHLATLSQGSVDLHFDPFVDIDWDTYDVSAENPQWILPAEHEMGAHPWYQALSPERQRQIGRAYMAQVAKVGLEFENLLIRGLMQYVYDLPNGSPEFRYVTHEATEETHHTQMFQEFANRCEYDAPGMPAWTKTFIMQTFIPGFARLFPEFFFILVLGGEEPIDHMQKVYLRAGEGKIHPLMRRIMQIHVAEEARHISFAHAKLTEDAPAMGRVRRGLLSVLTPLAFRIMADMILIPPGRMCQDLDIPREVVKDIYWGAPERRVVLSEIFGDVRMLTTKVGLVDNRVARALWKRLHIGGTPSRYRGEIHDRSIHDREPAQHHAA